MNYLSCPKSLAAAAFGLLALAASSAAQAGADVHFSIGFPAPVYVEPAPVYVQPRPVYVQPQPVYVQPQPVYVQPQPVYVQPQPVYMQPPHRHHGWHRRGPWGDRDGDGVPNAYDRGHPGRHWRHAEHHQSRGDMDRDGVPNRHDQYPGNRYRY